MRASVTGSHCFSMLTDRRGLNVRETTCHGMRPFGKFLTASLSQSKRQSEESPGLRFELVLA